ncbi:hypothetical protein AM1_E0009 (plasmid) [Acaryochloris marina MBIC11017]|uniref:Uncharacterized protein n=1 Tax=Acaryochloris marina (strain MBIC 11017) TaxID=329726 RepID=A8ZP43_ACAM1|nr:hypothetical protein AM1_E0009 [Acaryochloris marina MBIC11017]
MESFKFDDTKIELLRTLIKTAESSGEFRKLIYGNLTAQAGPATASVELTVEDPNAGV